VDPLDSLSSLCHVIDANKLARCDADDAEGDYPIRPINDRDEDDERGREIYVEPARRFRSRSRSPQLFPPNPVTVIHPSSTARRGKKGLDEGGVEVKDVELNEEQLMLLPPYVYGFAFADKIYCMP
jgi:hypothetical protein